MNAAWVALAGAAVYLDTTAVGQIMIGQPIVACPLWGLIVGRPEIGLFFGVVFQLLWLGSLAIGAAKFPEGNVGAFVATALASQVPPSISGEPAWVVLTAAALVGIITAQFGSHVTPLVRKVMNLYVPQVVESAANGRAGKFRVLFAGAIAIHALAGFVLTLAAFVGGMWILSLYTGNFSSAGVSRAVVESTDALLSGIWPAMLGAGVAVIAFQFVRKRHVAWFALSGALFFALGWVWQS
jgi:mannose/fructose/N-acetylgalactosamine-specific phosphotransferase system component IIC